MLYKKFSGTSSCLESFSSIFTFSVRNLINMPSFSSSRVFQPSTTFASCYREQEND